MRVDEIEGPKTLRDVAEWFLGVYDDLLDDDEEAEQFLENEEAALKLIRRNYISGDCGAFAIAVSERTGWPIYDFNGMHKLLRHPSGRFVDFTGFVTLPELKKRYGVKPKAEIVPREISPQAAHTAMEDEHEPYCDIKLARFVLQHLRYPPFDQI